MISKDAISRRESGAAVIDDFSVLDRIVVRERNKIRRINRAVLRKLLMTE